MAKRIVVWTRTADIQFVGILDYWLKKNKSNAYPKKLISEVSQRTEQLSEMPFAYKKTNFKDVRVASMGNYSIYYKVTEKEIIVSSFWDNRQDPKNLLKLLNDKK